MEALGYFFEEATLEDPPCSYMWYCKALEKALTELSFQCLSEEDLGFISRIRDYIKDYPEKEIEDRDPCAIYYEE